jgi:hypothetical protein
MTEHVKKRKGADQRIDFIEFFSFWEGGINRTHLIDQFGLSAPQASADLATYQLIAPGNLKYDLSSKRYVTSDTFHWVLRKPSAEQYMKQLSAVVTEAVEKSDTWLGQVPPVDIIPIPTRHISAEVLRQILQAIKLEKSIEIEYHSMNPVANGSMWRRITPHSFASDGLRWHIRAYCHQSAKFKDFLLSRCSRARCLAESAASASDDICWHQCFNVELVPNPQLTESQKQAIEYDYQMKDGKAILAIRYALLYYFEKRLRSDIASNSTYAPSPTPLAAPVVVANREEYTQALLSMGISPLTFSKENNP